MRLGRLAASARTLWCGALALGGIAAAIPGQALALDKITFGTDWVAEGEHGGYYEAVAAGIYKKYGLDVVIQPGGPQVNNAQLLASGQLDVALISSGIQAINFAKNNVPIVNIAAWMQKNPQILMAHEESGFKSLADIKGHPVMISSFSQDAFWPWLKSAFGYTDDQIRPYTFNLAPYFADKMAVVQGYATNEPYTAIAQGAHPKVFLMADYGYRDYGALFGVLKKNLDAKRDVWQRFVNATVEGWEQFLYGDASPAFALIKKDNPDMTDDGMKNSLDGLKKYGIIDSGDAKTLGLGAITEARMKELYDQMSKAGMFQPPGDYWKAAFDTSFADKKFGLK